ncbi:exonuclease mut-7 homolog [Drosophila albomicans]|uniref:Exonuclease mut-7 homolog n=1 Tax=Drosophila albomicans TaxID=7291 RepID=A0A6P8WQU0_DROAB|nr:exonuclease mut-7 homolog [Drosophila albomicans]
MAKLYNAIPAGFESDDEELDYLIGNLKIKRLEDITTGAGIDGDFDATLDPEFEAFFKMFRDKWNMHNKCMSPYMRQDLSKTLMRHENPLLLALKIFANCPDNSNVKIKSLSYFVLDTVCKLQADMPQLSEQCDDNTSMIAFHFVKTTGMQSLMNAMIETYRLQQIRELLVPKLREMLDGGHYKDVAQWAINLKLTHQFDMLDLAFPLIAQEKLPLAELYLEQATHQRLPFVKFLDSLLHKDKSVIEMCENILDRYSNLKVSHHVLRYRPISKIVDRLAKKYGFDDSVTPNYKFTKTAGYLHHLYREYEKSHTNLESFRELVRVHAYDYALQADFVGYLFAAGGPGELEAVYWSTEFKLLPEDCPPEIKSMISHDELRHQQMEQSKAAAIGTAAATTTSPAAGCDMYLSMDLPDECLIIVDTAAQFERMLQHLQCEPTIYMDSEWMQKLCVQNQLCLLQIATMHNVYLIDCLASHELHDEHWRSLGSSVFNNVNIMKVGFSMLNDLSVLQRSLPLQLRLQMPHHYLDLRTVWLELKKQRHGVELPFGNLNRAGEALTDLSMLCLGKKLNKANQCSNWANRPLRREQVLYAAMDARCLMLIHCCLTRCVPDINAVIEKSIACNNFLRRGNNNVK